MATVTNTIKLPDGSTPAHAAAVIELVASTTTRAAGWVTATDVTILSKVRPTVTSGAWSADLTPNADITPSGTVYKITETADRTQYVHYISVGPGGGTVHDLLVDAPASLPSAALTDHIADASGAHAASAISIADAAGTYSGATVEAALAEIGVRDVVLPAATGSDLGTINDTLTGYSGGVVRGRPGETYTIDGPIVIPSDTTLVMTGCTVVLANGSDCNIVNNAAVSATRRVLDAVTTSASTTLTSATAAFTVGDVGKAITIQGAGANGTALTTTIAAHTNSTTITLADAAGSSVTGQYAAVGPRDANVRVIGGLWDRRANGPAGSINGHNMRFRHVDGLTVSNTTHAATAGKYAVNPGDCTMVRVENTTLHDYSSDGVHLNGPCDRVHVFSTLGNEIGDDLVSLTARDSIPGITDCAGDITNVVVDTSSYRTSLIFSSALKVVAGQTTDGSADYAVRNLKARNLTGPTDTAAVVFIGDDSGGQFHDIDLQGVHSLGSAAGGGTCVLFHGGTVSRARLRDITPASNDSFGVSNDTTINRLRIDGIEWDSERNGAAAIYSTGSIARLSVAGVQALTTGGSNSIVRLPASTSAVSHLTLSDVTFEASSTNNYTVRVDNASSTLDYVHFANLVAVGVAHPLGFYKATTAVSAVNVVASGATSWLYASGASAAVSVVGAVGLVGNANSVSADAPGFVRYAARNRTIFDTDPDLLTSGEETFERLYATGNLQTGTGQLILTYFTARKTETINNVRTMTQSTGAGTPTLCKVGIYSVAAGGDLTLVASTANDTTMWAGTFSGYTRALSSSWSKVAGQRYAFATLFVGTTGPRLFGVSPALGAEGGTAPRINGSVAGQSDLPASIAAGSVTNSQGFSVYGTMTP